MFFPVYSEQMRPRAFLVLFREVSSGSLHWSQRIFLKFFFAKTSLKEKPLGPGYWFMVSFVKRKKR